MSLPTGAARARASRLRPDSRARSRLTVVPPRATTARSGPFVLLIATILVVGLIGLLMLNLSMQKASFRLASLQDRAEALQTREQSLDLKVDRLASSDRLVDEATRLGMVPNPNPVFLDLSNGSVIGDPAVAVPRAVPVDPLAEAESNATDDDKPANDDKPAGGDESSGRADDKPTTDDRGSATDGRDSLSDDRGATDDRGGTADDRGTASNDRDSTTNDTRGPSNDRGDSTSNDRDSADSGAKPRDRQPDATGRD
jgi:hypothetical protein